MGRGITPNKAIGVLRDVRSAEAAKNNTEVSEDEYVLPSESYFTHQRLMLYQICHHLGVLALESADQSHSSHDAATKKRIGVFHYSVRAEKDGHVLDFPRMVRQRLKQTQCRMGSHQHLWSQCLRL